MLLYIISEFFSCLKNGTTFQQSWHRSDFPGCVHLKCSWLETWREHPLLSFMEQVLQAPSSLWESSEPMICDSIGRCFADSPHLPPRGTVRPHSLPPTVAEGAMHLLTVPGGSRLHCKMLFDRNPSSCFQSFLAMKLSNYENRRIRIFSKHLPVWVFSSTAKWDYFYEKKTCCNLPLLCISSLLSVERKLVPSACKSGNTERGSTVSLGMTAPNQQGSLGRT